MTNSGTQRAELHKTIWSIANVLRGSVDGWDFKQYVLGFLFYRFISEDITSYLNEYEHQTGDVDFDYAKLDDATAEQVRKSMVEEKGYFILPSDLFATATWMLPVFAYGSQLARILHHAYSDGMMATPSVTTSATGFFRMRFTSRRKMAKTWCIKPPRGYWSQHLRAAACPCGNTRLGSSSRDPVDIL